LARGLYLLYYEDMSRSKCNRVFILGAGCSAGYGYPLGLSVLEELRSFLATKILSGCPVIQAAVSESVDLAARFPHADTLDKVVNLSEEHFNNFRRREGGCTVTVAHNELRTLTDKQILDAKIATTALFLDKEREARKKTLTSYKECLLPSIFGRGTRWQSAVNDSDCTVLTFNYDRLFEIAFLDYFKEFDARQFSVYGKSVLNSGFDFGLCRAGEDTKIVPDGFCFLKLHGSAGWWAKQCSGNLKRDECRCYSLESAQCAIDILQLERWLAQNKQFYKWEPLIAFPHEKQRFTSRNPGDFVQGPYIDKVWKHAAAVLGEVSEVTVIGYSFPEIDRAHMIENLLSKTPSATSIRIKNTNIAAVKSALDGIKILEGRLVFEKRTF